VVCENLDLSKDHFDKVLFRARERLKQKLMHNLKISPSHLGKILSILVGVFIAFDEPTLTSNEYHAVRENPNSYHLSIMPSPNEVKQ
jgi:RNA polymerase sigma-70 factor (ECF subfamily)